MPSEMLQELDFSQRPLRQYLFAEHVGDLLNGDTLACLIVGCGTASKRSQVELVMNGEKFGSDNA